MADPMMVFAPDGGFEKIVCDTCGTDAPSKAEIIVACGMLRLGWHCEGGTHICPDCPHPVVAERVRARPRER